MILFGEVASLAIAHRASSDRGSNSLLDNERTPRWPSSQREAQSDRRRKPALTGQDHYESDLRISALIACTHGLFWLPFPPV